MSATQTAPASEAINAGFIRELRRICGGPEVAQATVTQLQARIEFLRKRLSSR